MLSKMWTHICAFHMKLSFLQTKFLFKLFLRVILVAVLLQKCMNPPALITVTDALEYLEKLQLVVASPDRGRHAYHPTKYGELLLSMPLSLESATFVVRGGTAGYVRESVILGAIMDTTPFPILQPFNQHFQVGPCNCASDWNSNTNGTESRSCFIT